MNPTFDSRTVGLLLVALGWALCLALIGSPEILLFTVPVFLLAAPLALGRYVGEGVVAAIGNKSRPCRATSGCPGTVAYEVLRVSAGGSLLIASNLAGRAPPVAFV